MIANPSTIGRSLFTDPVGGTLTVAETRQVLEVKLAACLARGGCNGFPVHVDRIKNPMLRQLVAAGMVCKNWNVQDLADCHGDLSPAAGLALIATLENPVWGADDFHLLGAIEALENLQQAATEGGRAL